MDGHFRRNRHHRCIWLSVKNTFAQDLCFARCLLRLHGINQTCVAAGFGFPQCDTARDSAFPKGCLVSFSGVPFWYTRGAIQTPLNSTLRYTSYATLVYGLQSSPREFTLRHIISALFRQGGKRAMTALGMKCIRAPTSASSKPMLLAYNGCANSADYCLFAQNSPRLSHSDQRHLPCDRREKAIL